MCHRCCKSAALSAEAAVVVRVMMRAGMAMRLVAVVRLIAFRFPGRGC
jgi:hypothetical protein